MTGGRLLVTGATGFLGHHALAGLLRRGVACAALLRPPLDASAARLAVLLAALGVDAGAHRRSGRLLLLEGDVNGKLPRAVGAGIDAVLHAAACTDLLARRDGDPWRTNVEGTARLRAWAAERGVERFFLVSTAYRCGVVPPGEPVAERLPVPGAAEPAFHNAYERSKWHAEAQTAAWAADRGVTLTVLRPSVVVGHRTTGRTTAFGGFYLVARAAEVLARSYGDDTAGRRATGVRVVGDPDARTGVVPVDHVTALMVAAVTDHRFHGGVYHLTHPEPPTQGLIKRTIDAHFGLAGSGFVAPEAVAEARLSPVETLFHEATGPASAYLAEAPRFDRAAVEKLEAAAGLSCPPLNAEELDRMIGFAEGARWGRPPRRKRAEPVPDDLRDHDGAVAAYFRRWLPERVARSEVARETALTASVRFVLIGEPALAWRCRFVAGVLAGAEPAGVGPEPEPGEDAVYATSRAVFWDAVAGEVDPERVFLDGRATVRGDVEAALGLAVVLRAFNEEFPCTPGSLAKLEPEPEPAESAR